MKINNKKEKPTSCWVYYADEKCIGGETSPLEDFQQILDNASKLSSYTLNLLNEAFSQNDSLGEISLRWGDYTNDFYEEGDHRTFLPESIVFEDTDENVFYAICRIKNQCEWIRYAYYISDKEGYKWYNYIGKNDPVTDKSTIEQLQKRLAIYKDLQTDFLIKQEERKQAKIKKISDRNEQIAEPLLTQWKALSSLLNISTRTANKIYKNILTEENIFNALLGELIEARYIAVIDWKDAAEDVIYNYNLLSKKLKGTQISLEIDNDLDPSEVFPLLAQKSEFALYQINIDADSYFIGLCPKENTEAVQYLYKELFSVLKNETTISFFK